MSIEERWVDIEEVAKQLDVNKDSVYSWIEGKGLPAHRVGRLYRCMLSEVDAWVVKGGGDAAVKPAEEEVTRVPTRTG